MVHANNQNGWQGGFVPCHILHTRRAPSSAPNSLSRGRRVKRTPAKVMSEVAGADKGYLKTKVPHCTVQPCMHAHGRCHMTMWGKLLEQRPASVPAPAPAPCQANLNRRLNTETHHKLPAGGNTYCTALDTMALHPHGKCNCR